MDINQLANLLQKTGEDYRATKEKMIGRPRTEVEFDNGVYFGFVKAAELLRTAVTTGRGFQPFDPEKLRNRN